MNEETADLVFLLGVSCIVVGVSYALGSPWLIIAFGSVCVLLALLSQMARARRL